MHTSSSKSRNNLVIVKGNSKSKLLKKCIPITMQNENSKNPPYYTSPEIQKFLGIRDYITYSVPVVIEDPARSETLECCWELIW
ncbi:MAG: hypothetical protein IPL67_17825 [Ignavibacteria bacterium]|nr:hypothetical protein [Ignavibacteria bacterium]